MNLEVNIAGLRLENPLMPAAGPLVGDDDKMHALEQMGVGAMVSKTISVDGAVVPRPCIFGGRDFIMNAELWSEFDYRTWIDEFLPRYRSKSNLPLIISVGYTKEDMAFLIPKLDPFADAFEISTHYVGKDLDLIGETVREIRANTAKPIFMKISPHIPDPAAFARMVLENGGNGVVAINSLGPTMQIDLKSRSVVLGNKDGEVWISGPAIKPLALGIVHRIKSAVPQCTVIGVGGIASATDVLEFILAGADAVQMLSAAMLKGKDLYESILADLPKALALYGFDSIESVRSSKLKTGDMRLTPDFPSIDLDRCTRCGLCMKICPYFAMTRGEDGFSADREKCFGCGLCQSRCPAAAISGVYA